MKFRVNENCIGCELCAQNCPQVFSMTERNLAHAVKGDVEPAVRDAAIAAMENCPTSAIEAQ